MIKILFIFLFSCFKTFEQIKTEETKQKDIVLEKEYIEEDLKKIKQILQDQKQEILDLQEEVKKIKTWKDEKNSFFQEISLEEKALKSFEKKEYKEALALYSKLFLESPLKERSLFYMSLCFLHLKDKKKMEEALQELTKLNQKSPYLVLKKHK